MPDALQTESKKTLALAFFVLRRLGVADRVEEELNDVFAALPFRLRLEVCADPMAEHGDGDLLDVVDGHAEAAVHRGHRLAAQDEKLPCPRSGAPIDHFLHEFG